MKGISDNFHRYGYHIVHISRIIHDPNNSEKDSGGEWLLQPVPCKVTNSVVDLRPKMEFTGVLEDFSLLT